MKEIVNTETIDGSVNGGLDKIPVSKKQSKFLKIVFILALALAFLAVIISI